jgi:NADPH:quinone reductase-like Zn-dependent oxidoreductase/SAM-dependent methyltransferase
VRGDVVFPMAGFVAIAGEAVRQITIASDGRMGGGYCVRQVMVRTALVLSESEGDEGVEIVTALRAGRVTDQEDSVWWEFVIASHNGSAWVRHCEGQVMPLREDAAPTVTDGGGQLPRRVGKTRLYDALARSGLDFGPEFQLLTNISSSVTEGTARADLVQSGTQVSQPYPGHMHPASIDGCIQLLLVANARGLCRDIHQLVVPTRVEHMEVWQGTAEMHVRADASGSPSEVECTTSDGRVALRMSGLRVSSALDSDGDHSTHDPSTLPDAHAAARLQWLPDLDLAPLANLIQPPSRSTEERELQEILTLLCILSAADKLSHLTRSPNKPHFTKYRSWLDRRIALAQSGSHPLVPSAASYATLPAPSRDALLKETYHKLLALEGRISTASTQAIYRIHSHIERLFSGEQDTLSLLMQDDLLTQIYNDAPFDYTPFLQLLSHARAGDGGGLRILEVGAGTGGTTARVLASLDAISKVNGGLLPCREYVFTDVSAGFFPSARERFSQFAENNMVFRTLDISRPPTSQEAWTEKDLGSFDLVIAPNVVHATPCLGETLRNLRAMLKPDGGGWLLLNEIVTHTGMLGFVFGCFEGWWLGEADGRVWGPHVDVERWDWELRGAGLSGVEAAVADGQGEEGVCVALLSRTRQTREQGKEEGDATLLCLNPEAGLAAELISGLREEGWAVTPCTLGEQLPQPGQDVIACVDLEMNFFEEERLTKKDFTAFQALLRHLRDKDQHILWLTRPFQVRSRDPRGAQTLGVMRSIRAELGLPLFTLELDWESERPQAAGTVGRVFATKVRGVKDGDVLNADREFVLDNGVVHVGRHIPFSLTKEESELTALITSTPQQQFSTLVKTLHLSQPGDLSTLHWRSHPLPPSSSLPDDHILVQIHSAGLNFRDILFATASLPPSLSGEPRSETQLGVEASGTILATGRAVTHLSPGNRVLLLSTAASTLTTHLVIPASLVVPLPESLPLAIAAAAPVCFATALYALQEVGGLRRGMSVLIHSACGGVGLAALQVCRMVGVEEVYATIGSAEKRAYLVGREGIPAHRVFSSRDGGFLQGVREGTKGRGVDLVLNSLSGELLHQTWECVADYGVMVELGKRDFVGGGRLDMKPFLGNRRFVGVDLYQLGRDRPDKIGQ